MKATHEGWTKAKPANHDRSNDAVSTAALLVECEPAALSVRQTGHTGVAGCEDTDTSDSQPH